jgi:hypothetical protein
MKTAGKIALHTWFIFSIAVCAVAGDFFATAICGFWYAMTASAIH